MQLCPIFIAISFLKTSPTCLHRHYCLSQCSSQENCRGLLIFKFYWDSIIFGIYFYTVILTAFFYLKTNIEEILNTLFHQIFFIQLLNFPARILVLAITVSGLCILQDFCSVLQIYHRTDEAQSK